MDIPTLHTISQQFVHELQLAEQGQASSLSYIKHNLSPIPLVKPDEVFQVITIGGSVFKKALFKKATNQLVILSSEQKFQPPFPTEELLLSFIEKEIDPKVQVVAINFAYPLRPIFEMNRLDGILIQGTKENSFTGLVGKKLCATIEEYVLKTRQQKILAACANDTICLLLSGLVEKDPTQLAAGIVGTGMNFALFLDQSSAINLEAANFNKFPQAEEGKIIDAESIAPRSALFEKEISGAYLPKFFNLRAKRLGLHVQVMTSEELDGLALDKTPDGDLARDVLKHSAQLLGCAVAGIAMYKKSPMTFVMEGSLYWNAHEYKETVAKTAVEIAPQFPVSFISIADSYFLGPAKLVS